MSLEVHRGSSLPMVLCDSIAVLAIPDQFQVEIAEYEYFRDLKVTLPRYILTLTLYCEDMYDKGIGPEEGGMLPYFATIEDVAREDIWHMKYRCDSMGIDAPKNLVFFFQTDRAAGNQTHEHFSYFSSPNAHLLVTSNELANDVRLCDLPAVDITGKRRIYRRLQQPFVTGDVECPWCCGKRDYPLYY